MYVREQVAARAGGRRVARVFAVAPERHGRTAGHKFRPHVVQGGKRSGRGLLELEVPHQADADCARVEALRVRAERVHRAAGEHAPGRRDHEVVADRDERAVEVPALDRADVPRLSLERRSADPARRERGVGRSAP
jgi:hypothetical protein